MKARAEAVFREVFELPGHADVSALQQGVSERWDSLGHVTLVVGLESEFGLEFSIAESLEVTSFDAAMQILQNRLGTTP